MIEIIVIATLIAMETSWARDMKTEDNEEEVVNEVEIDSDQYERLAIIGMKLIHPARRLSIDAVPFG